MLRWASIDGDWSKFMSAVTTSSTISMTWTSCQAGRVEVSPIPAKKKLDSALVLCQAVELSWTTALAEASNWTTRSVWARRPVRLRTSIPVARPLAGDSQSNRRKNREARPTLRKRADNADTDSGSTERPRESVTRHRIAIMQCNYFRCARSLSIFRIRTSFKFGS